MKKNCLMVNFFSPPFQFFIHIVALSILSSKSNKQYPFLKRLKGRILYIKFDFFFFQSCLIFFLFPCIVFQFNLAVFQLLELIYFIHLNVVYLFSINKMEREKNLSACRDARDEKKNELKRKK